MSRFIEIKNISGKKILIRIDSLKCVKENDENEATLLLEDGRMDTTTPYLTIKQALSGEILQIPRELGTLPFLRKKRVRCINTNVIYASIGEAARAFEVTPSALSRHLSGKSETCCGCRFEIVEGSANE